MVTLIKDILLKAQKLQNSFCSKSGKQRIRKNSVLIVRMVNVTDAEFREKKVLGNMRIVILNRRI